MIKDRFLSFLVSRQKLSPDDLTRVVKLQDSAKYFLSYAHQAGHIPKKQLQQLASLPIEQASIQKIGKHLVTSKILSVEKLGKILKEIQESTGLIENILTGEKIMSPKQVRKALKEFEVSPEAEEKPEDTGAEAAITAYMAVHDPDLRGSLRELLEGMGHQVRAYADVIEASNAHDQEKCDLIIAGIQDQHAVEIMEMLSILLDVNRNLYAAVGVEHGDFCDIPARLQFSERFLCEPGRKLPESLEPFVKQIARKKSSRSDLIGMPSEPAASKAPDPGMDDRIDNWLGAINIEYTKQGVTLFIDPKIVPRSADRLRQDHSEKKTFVAFIAAVREFLQDMRIEDLDQKAVEISVWYPWQEPVRVAPPQEKSRNATASFTTSPDGKAVLIDYRPPAGKGDNLRFNDIVREVRALAPEFFVLEDNIRKILEERQPTSGAKAAEKKDAQVEIEISPDKTEAYLTLRRPYGGNPISVDDVLNRLDRMKITQGLNRELAKEMAYSGIWDRKVPVAYGTPPVEGTNGRVVFNIRDDFEERRSSEHSIDHRLVSSMEKVSAGESIITVEPPTEGIPGIDVFGNVIPSQPGRPVKFSASAKADTEADVILGENVEMSRDGKAVISRIDGMLKRKGRKIEVSSVYEVSGDVDYSVGNLDVEGDVLVNGSVLSKFEVSATGNVYIIGSVEDAIISSGGSVYVEQGIYGHEKGIVFARDSVEARCIEQAHVFCRGRVSALTNISHALVVAFDAVSVTNPEGIIVGGTVKAGNTISASKIGSPSGTATRLSIASPLCIEDEMEELRSYMLKKISITERQSIRRKSDKGDGEEQQGGEQQVESSERDKYNGMVLKSYNKYFIDWLDNFIRKNRNRMSKFAPSETRHSRYRITSETRAYPGVQMKIRGFRFNIKSEAAGKRVFSLSGDRISESV